MQSIKPYGAFVDVGGIIHQPGVGRPSSLIIAAASSQQHAAHMHALLGCRQDQVQGLFLPASQVSHERLQSLDQIIEEGDKIKAMVLSFDREHGRVNFSTKQLEKTQGDVMSKVGCFFSFPAFICPAFFLSAF